MLEMKFIWTLLLKLVSKLSQLYCEVEGYAESLGDLMANLHFMSDKVDKKSVLVIVPSTIFRWYLTILQRSFEEEQIPVVVVRCSSQLAELMVKSPENTKRPQLIFARKLYFKHYAQVIENNLKQDIIVI
jgi:hypothetical protein